MSDTDEIRAALSDALRLPGEVQARPGAALAIRSRARSRRRNAVVAVAVAVPACLVAALLVTNGSSPTSTSVPATQVAPTPHPPSASAAEVHIAPGPRTLATPIEIRPVLREYLTCPAHAQTVPAIDGSTCYRLGPAAIVMHRVRDLSVALSTLADGAVGDRHELNLSMDARDTATFSVLTAASLHKQVAFVINGRVWLAPSIEGHITEGIISIPLPVDAGAAQVLVTELTG